MIDPLQCDSCLAGSDAQNAQQVSLATPPKLWQAVKVDVFEQEDQHRKGFFALYMDAACKLASCSCSLRRNPRQRFEPRCATLMSHLAKDWMQHHPQFQVLISDPGASFASDELGEWASIRGIGLLTSPGALHGLTADLENLIRVTERMARKLFKTGGYSFVQWAFGADNDVHGFTTTMPSEIETFRMAAVSRYLQKPARDATILAQHATRKETIELSHGTWVMYFRRGKRDSWSDRGSIQIRSDHHFITTESVQHWKGSVHSTTVSLSTPGRLQADAAAAGLELLIDLLPGSHWRDSYAIGESSCWRIQIDHRWLDYLRRDVAMEFGRCREGAVSVLSYGRGFVRFHGCQVVSYIYRSSVGGAHAAPVHLTPDRWQVVYFTLVSNARWQPFQFCLRLSVTSILRFKDLAGARTTRMSPSRAARCLDLRRAPTWTSWYPWCDVAGADRLWNIARHRVAGTLGRFDPALHMLCVNIGLALVRIP